MFMVYRIQHLSNCNVLRCMTFYSLDHSRWTKYKWQGRRKMKKIVREFLNAEIVRTCFNSFALVFKEEKKERKKGQIV